MSELYGYKEQERLDTDIEDTVRRVIEDGCTEFPIEINVFKNMNITEDVNVFAKNILENLLEDLDEEYSDPDGDYTVPSEEMKKASLAFAKVMVKEYHVWMCEPTGEVIKYSEDEALNIYNS